jgi:hypothetical protein
MEILKDVKQRISTNDIDKYENILHPSLSFTQSKIAYDTLIKFKMSNKQDDYVCYGGWGQTNKMYCINYDNDLYIFTLANGSDNHILSGNYVIKHLFILDDNYLCDLNIQLK